MKAALLLVVLSLPAIALASSDKTWETGKLMDYEKTSETGVYTNYATGQVQSNRQVIRHIEIAGSDLIYFADFRVTLFEHKPELIENSDIKYRVEKDSLWFVDETGREFKGRIIKRRKP